MSIQDLRAAIHQQVDKIEDEVLLREFYLALQQHTTAGEKDLWNELTPEQRANLAPAEAELAENS